MASGGFKILALTPKPPLYVTSAKGRFVLDVW